ncbi:adenylate kinase [Salinicola avicenniae]|uniref:adenylate kinase n=1 Tax=Salinicola avicenniae TaxID=2916836 RepID=UPI002072C23F|nr:MULTISPECIES: adenylate kinase [unclassified Salinicola]
MNAPPPRKPERINVIGTSASGKTTLAYRLAEVLDLPVIEMDRLQWRPNWQMAPDETFLAELSAALDATPGWVLDGNYHRTREIKWRNVDMIVWVDTSFWRTLRQAVSRAIRRIRAQEELWPGTGNRESLRRTFFSRDSVLLWMLKTWRSHRRRYETVMQAPRYAHIRFVRLRNRREVESFIELMARQG